MKIPKTFKIAGQKFKVEYSKKLLHKEDKVGQVRFRENRIFIQPPLKGSKIPKSHIAQTYLHEVVHVILYYMREGTEYTEGFVDLFAEFLYQILESSEGEL